MKVLFQKVGQRRQSHWSYQDNVWHVFQLRILKLGISTFCIEKSRKSGDLPRQLKVDSTNDNDNEEFWLDSFKWRSVPHHGQSNQIEEEVVKEWSIGHNDVFAVQMRILEVLQKQCKEYQVWYHLEEELYHLLLVFGRDVLSLPPVQMEAEVVQSD